jgi:formylmethanofuran dehydrogenase subunit D
MLKSRSYELSPYNVNGTRTICGTTEKKTFYDCRAISALNENESNHSQKVYISESMLQLINFREASLVVVYNMSGRKVLEEKVAGANTSLSLKSIPKGIYIVSVLESDFTHRNYKISYH